MLCRYVRAGDGGGSAAYYVGRGGICAGATVHGHGHGGWAVARGLSLLLASRPSAGSTEESRAMN